MQNEFELDAAGREAQNTRTSLQFQKRKTFNLQDVNYIERYG
jgi:hypothetical protein